MPGGRRGRLELELEDEGDSRKEELEVSRFFLVTSFLAIMFVPILVLNFRLSRVSVIDPLPIGGNSSTRGSDGKSLKVKLKSKTDVGAKSCINLENPRLT